MFHAKYHWAVIALFVFLAGCQLQPPGKECFRSATGFDLPEEATAVHAKTFTVLPAGDTYYVKFSTTKDITAFIAEHFTPASWDEVERDITPPKDWKSDLPFWNRDEIKKGVCYEGQQEEGDEVSFISAMSYDPASGVLYFYGAQCR